MVGKESFGRSEVPSPEGGGGVTGIWFFILYIFQIVVNLLKIIKWLLPPSKKGYLLFLYDHRRSAYKLGSG